MIYFEGIVNYFKGFIITAVEYQNVPLIQHFYNHVAIYYYILSHKVAIYKIYCHIPHIPVFVLIDFSHSVFGKIYDILSLFVESTCFNVTSTLTGGYTQK